MRIYPFSDARARSRALNYVDWAWPEGYLAAATTNLADGLLVTADPVSLGEDFDILRGLPSAVSTLQLAKYIAERWNGDLLTLPHPSAQPTDEWFAEREWFVRARGERVVAEIELRRKSIADIESVLSFAPAFGGYAALITDVSSGEVHGAILGVCDGDAYLVLSHTDLAADAVSP
jgi:hypothetical protein